MFIGHVSFVGINPDLQHLTFGKREIDMSDSAAVVDNLTKVTLDLELGTAPGTWDLTPGPVTYEFVFGVGSSGLAPFEYQLAGLSEGETVTVLIQGSEIWHFFGFLRPPVFQYTGESESFHLKARIVRIARAESREVIKAMAEQAACGDCGGDCCGHGH